jgi:hypothetical protein
MKKLISLMLVLCMALAAVSAMAETATAVTGEWYLKSIKMGEQELDAASMGFTMTMNLKEDGSVEETSSMGPGTGTWTLEGDKLTVTIDGSPATGTVADGVLTLTANEQEMIFTREVPEAKTMAEVKTDATAAEFEGKWNCSAVSAMGFIMDAAAVEASGTVMPGMEIKNGTITFTGDSTFTAGMAGEIPTEFKDGALVYSVSMGEITVTIKAEMLVDGTVSVTMALGDTEIGLFFTKAAE